MCRCATNVDFWQRVAKATTGRLPPLHFRTTKKAPRYYAGPIAPIRGPVPKYDCATGYLPAAISASVFTGSETLSATGIRGGIFRLLVLSSKSPNARRNWRLGRACSIAVPFVLSIASGERITISGPLNCSSAFAMRIASSTAISPSCFSWSEMAPAFCI